MVLEIGTELITQVTAGHWTDERDSAAVFDKIVEESGLFKVYKEVRGYYLQPRMMSDRSDPRIDRVLVPRQELADLGWEYGPIGIELKKSNVKIGPVIAQAMDYSRAVWHLPKGYNVVLDWIFIWPLEKQHGAVASLMAQSRIGGAWRNGWSRLFFFSGEICVFRLHPNGKVEISPALCGRKAGSR